MLPSIEELNSFIGDCAARMEALATSLPEERSAFNDAETAELDQLDAWVDEARALIARVEKIERAKQHPGAQVPGFYAPNVNRTGDAFDLAGVGVGSTGSQLRARALTAVESIRNADDKALDAAVSTMERFDDARGTIALRFLATGSEAYRSAWGKLVSGRSWALDTEERAAVERAASLTDASGGYAVPFLLDPTVILTNDGTTNPFRQIARTVRGVSDKWNGVSSAGVTASWDGEAAEVSDDAPTLAQPSIPAHKAQAFIPFSDEIAQDWAALGEEMRALLADAKDRLEGAAFATGTGSSQPTGIVTALVAGSRTTATSTSNALVVADLYSVMEAVGPRFRGRASWAMNIAILNDIRQLATANNYHAFTVDLTSGGPSQLLGRPVYESSDMDGTYGSGENYAAVFGDFSSYVIYDRVGMSVELIPHLFATQNNRPSGQRGFYAHWRVGADSVNDSAFTVLNIT